ncbi:hypothetical protein ACET3Z_014341 [Daucus carota]
MSNSVLKASCSSHRILFFVESCSSFDNSSLQWIPPPVNLVKFNCDGAFKRGATAIGVIGRNFDGKLVDGRGDSRPNIILNAEKELRIVAGLQDRVVQVYGGLVYMDLSKNFMDDLGHGVYCIDTHRYSFLIT